MASNMQSPEWSQRLLSELQASDARAIAVAKDLTLAQLNWKPAPGQWSIGQCLEHLAVSNEVYGAAIASALPGAPADPVDEITLGWFSRYFIREFAAPVEKPKVKKKAPRKIKPIPDVDTNILKRFLDTNTQTKALVERAQGVDVNRVRFKNPFVFWIRFTVGAGLEILSKHEQRHLRQAERVKNAPGFPSS
jgi:hypothetical protein